jgi:hypothetical protein
MNQDFECLPPPHGTPPTDQQLVSDPPDADGAASLPPRGISHGPLKMGASGRVGAPRRPLSKPDAQKLATERAETLRDEEWQLHNECITLAREALDLYKAQGEKHLRIPDLTRLIDLASRLGRLATGIPTAHIEHAWSEYQNQLWTTQFEADLKRIYGKSDDNPKEGT